MKFFEKKGLLISPLGYIKPGPLSSHQDIYIYIALSLNLSLNLSLSLSFSLSLSLSISVSLSLSLATMHIIVHNNAQTHTHTHIALHCQTLHCITLHYIILHYTTVHAPQMYAIFCLHHSVASARTVSIICVHTFSQPGASCSSLTSLDLDYKKQALPKLQVKRMLAPLCCCCISMRALA